MPFSLLEKVFEDFGAMGGETIELSGGDPTEHPDFEEILSEARRHAQRVIVFSNNTGFDNASFVSMLKKHRAELHFTLLGIGSTHDELCGAKTYEKVIDRYESCKRSGVASRCHFVPMAKNYHDLSKILKIIPATKLLRLMPQGRAWDNWENIALRDTEVKELSIGVESGGHSTIPFYRCGNCGAGTEKFLVTPLGSVVPCASFKRYSVKLGNLHEDRLGFVLSNENPRFLAWNSIKKSFYPVCWGDYLYGIGKQPLAYDKMMQEFGGFDGDFSRWIERPSECCYVVGAHGVGKSTLIRDVVNEIGCYFYENESKNPYKDDARKRQLWRLYKYKFDDERLKSIPRSDLIVNRCPIDWLVYTNAFLELNWITEQEHAFLTKRYYQLFGGVFVPMTIVYLNPSKKWSEERIVERWEKTEKKWREDDFEYYDMLRSEYANVVKSVKGLSNVVEIRATDRAKRVSIVRKSAITSA